MTPRKTLLFAIVLAILVGLYLWDHHRVSTRKSQEEEEKKLFQWKPGDVAEVILERPSGTVKLIKEEEGKWALKEPVVAKADQDEVNRLVENLLKARKDRVIAEDPSDLEPYGLTKPAYVVTMKGSNPQGERVVLIGSKNPTEVYHYARLQGEKKVFLVSDALRRDVEKNLLELRDKTLIKFETQDVESVRVAGENQEVVLKKTGDRQWEIEAPGNLHADADAVQSLLFKLSRTKAVAFEDTPQKSLSEMGLDPPKRKIGLKLKGQDGEATILLGEVVEEGTQEGKKQRLWAKLEGDSPVVQIEASQVGEVPVGVDGWRSKVLISFERDKVAKIELAQGDDVLAIKKVAENQWEVERPERLPADSVKVSDLLWTLKDARAEGFLSPGDLEASVEGPAVLTARVWVEGRQEPLSLEMGPEVPQRGGYYAKAPEQQGSVLVSRKLVEDLKKFSSWELREKRFVSFDVAKARRFHLKWEGKELEVVKKGDGEWQISKPDKEPVDTYKVTSLLWTVREARFEEPPKEKLEQGSLGREEPKFEIRIFTDGKDPSASFNIGAEIPDAGGKRYAWCDPNGPYYVVGKKLLDEITKDLKAIRPSLVEGGPK